MLSHCGGYHAFLLRWLPCFPTAVATMLSYCGGYHAHPQWLLPCSPTVVATMQYILIYLIYCIQIWSIAATSSLNVLIRKQKMASCLIHNALYNSHTESFFKSSAILPVILIIDYFRIQLMHQFVYNLLPVSFANCWMTNIARREAHDCPALRNEDNIFVPFSCLMSTERHPFIIFPKTWNKLSSFELKNNFQQKQLQ